MIDVAAGVLTDRAGRVLLIRRLPGTHLAGRWEFPGGKLEPGETIAQALTRELREELGIAVLASAPLISIPWQYPEHAVRLHALRVLDWRGEPQAREGHPLRWVAPGDFAIAAMPPADAPIVTALRLPSLYAIATTDRLPGGLPARTGALPRATALVQLRMPGVGREEVRRVAGAWLGRDPSLRTRLLINHELGLARELGVGVQLRAAQLPGLRQRPLPADAWVGASCHDPGELELATRLGVDFATLSPVRATASHPAGVPLGWDGFATMAADARIPVYALGGLAPADLERARAAGAQGVAGIRAFRDPP